MNQSTFIKTTSIVIGLAAILHAIRLLAQWTLQLGPYQVPLWASGLVVVIGFYLAYQGTRITRR